MSLGFRLVDMAETIPNFLQDKPGDAGWQAEKVVFDSLKRGLPDHTLVIHSQEYLCRNKNSRLCEGEADFIIIDPDQGVLILEVKSGSLKREANGNWYHNHRPVDSPFEQARKQKYQLRGELEKYLRKNPLPFELGYAVAIPDSNPRIKAHTLENDPCMLITGRELPHIKDALTEVHKGFQKSSLSEKAKSQLSAVKDLFLREVHYGQSLAQLIKNEDQLRGSLTKRQYGLLQMLRSHKEVKIIGGPGSGKTLLAIHKAQELSKAGNSVLLLCYNRPLGNVFEVACNEMGDCFAQTFHTFAWEQVNSHTPGTLVYGDSKFEQSFWDEELPLRLLEVLEASNLKYDALIVDEAQDFHPNYCDSILAATHDATTFFKLVEIARPFLGRFKVFPPTSTILEYFYTLLHGDLLHTPA